MSTQISVSSDEVDHQSPGAGFTNVQQELNNLGQKISNLEHVNEELTTRLNSVKHLLDYYAEVEPKFNAIIVGLAAKEKILGDGS